MYIYYFLSITLGFEKQKDFFVFKKLPIYF